MRDARQGVKLVLQTMRELRIRGQMEKGVRERRSSGVAPSNDNEKAIAVQVQGILLCLWPSLIRVQDPRKDVRLLGLILGAAASMLLKSQQKRNLDTGAESRTSILSWIWVLSHAWKFA